MAANMFRAGAATSNITPPLGVSINGGMRNRVARHIHDELHARCLVLDDGQTQLALVICDSCMIPGAILDSAKHEAHGHTGIPPDHMLVAATHTHSAAAVAGVFQSEPEEAYAAFLSSRIADGIRRAVNNLAPAKIGWAVAKEPKAVFNRRWRMRPGTIPADPFGQSGDVVRMNPPRASKDLLEPAGPIDPGVSVLSVTTDDGRPLAVLANYSLHYVGGTGGGHISADYFGMFADRMGQALGADRLDPPFVGIMSNGTSGDTNNINFRSADTRGGAYTQMRRVAHLVADAAIQAINSISYHQHVPLSVRESRLKLARRMPTRDDVAKARFLLSQASGPELKARPEIYARETVLLSQMSPDIETVVQAIRIGDLGIASSPCETFVETGLAIKRDSPLATTFTIELANDYAGYLPTAEQHKLGGYETWRARSSFLEVGAEAKIRRRVLKLLGEVAAS